MIKLILFAIILQITNIFAGPDNDTIVCPNTVSAKYFCVTITCTDGLSNGEIAFRMCMSCFPAYLREKCSAEVAEHYRNRMTAEKANTVHLQKFVSSEEEIIVETK